MNKHADVAFGVAGTGGTFALNAVNPILGAIAGTLTIVLLCFRLRREWKHRDDPPTDT